MGGTTATQGAGISKCKCVCARVCAGPAAPHLLVQQASSVLLAAVAALSLLNVAGGADAAPAAMADLLRSPELKEQLEKCESARARQQWVDRTAGSHWPVAGAGLG